MIIVPLNTIFAIIFVIDTIVINLHKVQKQVSMATILIRNIVTGVYNEDANDVYTALGQQDEFKQLCEMISKATEELLLDTTQYGAEEQRETAVSQRALLLIDEIANRTSEIEEYCHKVKAVCESLSITVGISSMKGITMDPVVSSILPFIIHDLCTCGTFVSSTKDVSITWYLFLWGYSCYHY
jgi:hypothetical protein